jgi:hypothetical protein
MNAAYWAEVDRLNAEAKEFERERQQLLTEAAERRAEVRKAQIYDKLALARSMVPPMPAAALATTPPPDGKAIDIAEEARRRIEFEIDSAKMQAFSGVSIDNMLQVVHPEDERVLLTVLPTGKLEYAEDMDPGDYQYVIATILQHYMVVSGA